MRDLEGALEVEKSEVKEVKCNLDSLTKQHRCVKTITAWDSKRLTYLILRAIL